VRRPNEEILVGVKVRGQLQQPDFKLFSEPASLTQSEQLSWLVLGRGLGEASAAESSLVTRAALALGAKGGNFLARNIGDRIGVDDIGIESGGADAASAAFVVGKYLTPKLYVSYGIGLFRPVSTVRLRYILSPRWQLETQSNGTATGGDVIFSIERGGD
jgi:translocation and assembly module TamB